MKRILSLALICVLALSCLNAFAVDYGGEFIGCFDHQVNIRANPGDQKGNVGIIPPWTPVRIKPVSSVYGEVTYENAHGYVYLGQVIRCPEEKKVDPYILSADGNKVLWKLWVEAAGNKGSIPAGTPMLVTGVFGNYYRVFTAEMGDGYVHNRDTKVSVQGVAMTGSVYSDQIVDVFEVPIAGGAVISALEPEKLYTVTQLINGYFQVTMANGTPGFVLETEVQRSAQTAPVVQVTEAPAQPQQQTATVPNTVQTQAAPQPTQVPVQEVPQGKPGVVYLAKLDQATHFYPGPSRSNEIMEAVASTTVVVPLQLAANGFYLWVSKNVYVDGTQVEVWEATEYDQPRNIYCHVDVPLMLLPDPQSGKAGYTLLAGKEYPVRYQMDGYYVIPLSSESDLLAFVSKTTEGVMEHVSIAPVM